MAIRQPPAPAEPPARRRLLPLTGLCFACVLVVLHLSRIERHTGVLGRILSPTPSARIAYFIQVSSGNHVALPGLLGSLCDGVGKADFAVHFDASMPPGEVLAATRLAKRALRAAGCAPTDIVPVPREHVTYRGVTLTHNILAGISALTRAGRQFDFFINLSAADYPAARPALVRRLLGRARARRLSFFGWAPKNTWEKFEKDRFTRAHVDTALAAGSEGSRKPQDFPSPLAASAGFTVAKSSSWFILSRELAEHFVMGAKPRRMLSAFALSDTADEQYFASVVYNDQYFAQRVVPDSFRAVFWYAPNGTRSWQHPFYVDEVGKNGEPVFWESLLKRPAFFTRKVRGRGVFTERVDRRILGIGANFTSAERAARKRYEESLVTWFEDTVALHLAGNPAVRPLPPFTSAFRRKRRLAAAWR